MRHLYVLSGALMYASFDLLLAHKGWPSIAAFIAGTWMYVEAYRTEHKD